MTPGDLQNVSRAEPCDSCGGTGRWYGSDAPCPCPAGLPYYEAANSDPESMRLARELEILMAANHGI